ncbi:MAG: AbrB/MazE/SpoVT family DNA-binding domain-containing protein [Candidatus Anammoxibacter sp.]
MVIATISSKGQLVIPKEIRESLGLEPKQKVLLRVVKNHAVIEPIPVNPIEHFCGVFKKGKSLTKALLREKKENKKREK